MPRSITLSRQAQTTITQSGLTGYRFTVTVSAASGLDEEVFLYQRMPRDPVDLDGDTEDVFIGVCTPVDLAEVPLNNPGADDSPAYCRKASLDLMFRSSTEASDAWTVLQEQCQALLAALKACDSLESPEVVVLNDT